MVIDKKFKGLIKEGFRYVFNGDIETTESLEVDLDMGLFVTGCINAGGYIEAGKSVEAGEYINAGECIEAGWSIKAGRSIKAGGYMEAGWSIEAGEYIKAGGYIEAGEYIEAGWGIKAGGYINAGWSIKAGGYIEAGGYINAGGYIEAGRGIKADRYIKAGGYIEAGGGIKAGESSGIVAGLSITCEGTLSFGLKAFAGICSWREISEEEKTITCGKFNGGVVEYGILEETGLEEERKVELSMDEIAQKFGVAVKDLKIKKG